MLIDRLNILFDKPAHISEEPNFGVSLATTDPEFLRGL